MKTDFSYIGENYHRISEEISEAVAKYRDPAEQITFMAVTKTVAPEAVNYAVDCGIHVLGENRVQEYLSKKDSYQSGVEMHFIGHLQSNKVKYIIDDMALIHSVDSTHLAEEIDRQAARVGKVQDILIEVNAGGEESKSGVAPEKVGQLLETISELPHIHVKGLMTIPPIGASEKIFAKMQQLYLDISEKKIHNINMEVLSMGMSGDYIPAIQYGSTLVRIGTALFGARNYT